jgi:hypothetical protein
VSRWTYCEVISNEHENEQDVRTSCRTVGEAVGSFAITKTFVMVVIVQHVCNGGFVALRSDREIQSVPYCSLYVRSIMDLAAVSVDSIVGERKISSWLHVSVNFTALMIHSRSCGEDWM